MDGTEYDGPRHRRVGPVGRIGCLPLLAAALVSILLVVITVKMLESPTLWRNAPASGLAWPDIIPAPTDLHTTEQPTEPQTPTAVATSSPGPLPESQVMRYEAEGAYLYRAGLESNHDGYSGSGFVNYDNSSDGYVQWTFDAIRPGRVAVGVRYANGSPTHRPMNIVVNGRVAVNQLSFEPTGAWGNWRVGAVDVDLAGGRNIIRVVTASPDGGPNIDYLEIRY